MASLSAEEIELARYSGHLDDAYKAGIKEGLVKGLGNGMLFSSFYLSYALAFWYGTKQVGPQTDRPDKPLSWCIGHSC